MITDPLRPAPNFGTWEVICEYNDAEDNQMIDFTPYQNILVEIEDPFSKAVCMTLSKTRGEVTTPAPGIIMWKVLAGKMSGFVNGTYHVRMSAWKDEDPDDILALMDSSVSIVGDINQ